ncbi:MAG: SDR family NAD(P)-dependent oxidoreductase [Rhizobiaceae bacterium]
MSLDKVLAGRIALITGAAQGIGLAIATRLAADGASVIIADLNEAKAEEQAAELREHGYAARGAPVDVADRASVEMLSAKIGAVNILINNAGIYAETNLIDCPEHVWRKSLEVNLFGAIHCIQVFGGAMVKGGWGRIINMGSLLSATAFGSDLGYVVSKTALVGLTRSAAAEIARYGVTVNTICPGNILTDMMRELAPKIEQRDGLAPASFIRDRALAIPARRLGDPEDIAAMAAFLCRDDAGYINGQSLHVNGGLLFNP